MRCIAESFSACTKSKPFVKSKLAGSGSGGTDGVPCSIAAAWEAAARLASGLAVEVDGRGGAFARDEDTGGLAAPPRAAGFPRAVAAPEEPGGLPCPLVSLVDYASPILLQGSACMVRFFSFGLPLR